MAQRALDFVNPDFSLHSLAQGTGALFATFMVALGVSAFFTEIDAYAVGFGVPLPKQQSDKKDAKSSSIPTPASAEAERLVAPWVYAMSGRTLCCGLVGVELARRGMWEALGVWAMPVAAMAGVDAWVCYQYGNRRTALRHACALPVFALLGGYLATAEKSS